MICFTAALIKSCQTPGALMIAYEANNILPIFQKAKAREIYLLRPAGVGSKTLLLLNTVL
jgi:hypothetical protein